MRWPDGLPILETYEEYLAGNYAGTPDSCQSCHMAQLDEESSTYDITALGLVPSIANGWLRAPGEVRHHHFATTEYEGVTLLVTAEAEDDEVVATVTVRNSYGGHGLPTGAPMRQYIVHVEAVDDDGQGVAASGGQAIPEDGGWRHRGEMDVDAFLDGTSLTLAGQELAEVQTARFVRPTGEWDDHAGPGTGHFDDLAAEDKGLPLYEVLAERTVLSVADDTVEIDAAVPDLLPGDVVYLVGPDDAAGAPGWLYGKTFLDADGVRGVPHYRAVEVAGRNPSPRSSPRPPAATSRSPRRWSTATTGRASRRSTAGMCWTRSWRWSPRSTRPSRQPARSAEAQLNVRQRVAVACVDEPGGRVCLAPAVGGRGEHVAGQQPRPAGAALAGAALVGHHDAVALQGAQQ